MSQVDSQLRQEIFEAIRQVNDGGRCATHKDIVERVGLQRWSPETIPRAIRYLVEEGVVHRWNPKENQKRATFWVVDIRRD